MDITPITNCRLCLSPNLERALKLADIPLADGYSKEPKEAKLYPDELWICMECGHAQMGHMLNPEFMFREYHFHSGDSPAFVQHLRSQADDILARFGPKRVFEVGSNDGTLLYYFRDRGCDVLGVDPAEVESSVRTIRDFFTEEIGKAVYEQDGDFDCVVANHVFAHADDLPSMLEAIKQVLRPDGVFVFENAYALELVRGAYYDQIYHEHPSYHTLAPLIKFFAAHGMELFDAEINPCKGGSLRGFVHHMGAQHRVRYWRIADILNVERRFDCGNPKAYAVITERIEKQKAALPEGRLIGYGAASSCTPVIYNLQLQGRIEFLVDDNPRKQGLYSPGANIPIKWVGEIYNSELPCVNLALRYPQIAKKHPQKAMVTLQ